MMKLVIRNVETKISRIRYTLEKWWKGTHPYAHKMKEYGVKPEHIKTARDMQLLPTRRSKICRSTILSAGSTLTGNTLSRFHATSGTTGNPTVALHTE